MACFVQIFTYTTVYSKIKDKKNKNISLPTYPETEEYIRNRLIFFLGLRAVVCRPCDTVELTATSCNFSLWKVSADRQLFRYS